MDLIYLFGKMPFITQTDSMTNFTMGAGFFILFTWIPFGDFDTEIFEFHRKIKYWVITKLGNVSDHCDVTWLESVEAVDGGLEGGDRFGEIVLAIVPGDVWCRDSGGNGGEDCEVFCNDDEDEDKK